MTFRERLGNFISGGKLELYRDANRQSIKAMQRFEDECFRLKVQLALIEGQETPGANATVKRMARIAREALGI